MLVFLHSWDKKKLTFAAWTFNIVWQKRLAAVFSEMMLYMVALNCLVLSMPLELHFTVNYIIFIMLPQFWTAIENKFKELRMCCFVVISEVTTMMIFFPQVIEIDSFINASELL